MNPRYPSSIYNLFSKSNQNVMLGRAVVFCSRSNGEPLIASALQDLLDSDRPSYGLIVTTEAWENKERETNHDIAAWVELVREQLPSELRDDFYQGMTSSDLVDTALSFALREALYVIRASRDDALNAGAKFALRHRADSIRGRTHGQNAEYVSIGRRVAAQLVRLDEVKIGRYDRKKASGPVGIGGIPGDTQVANRGLLASVMGDLVELSLAIEQLALDVRLMARAPERLVYTPRRGEQRGSSSMPDKNNPIIAEQLCGLASVLRANARAVQDSTVLWEERDISHSSVERTAMVEALALSDYCLSRLTSLYDNLWVTNHLPKLEVTAVEAYDALTAAGVPRTYAYSMVARKGVQKSMDEVLGSSAPSPKGYRPELDIKLWERMASFLYPSQEVTD